MSIEVLQATAQTIARIAIDYSNQPPRELQIEAGTSLAIAGFIVTFAVLGIFTLLIKTTSYIATLVETKKPPLPPQPEARISREKDEAITLVAIATAIAHMLSKERKKPVEAPPSPLSSPDPWVLSERLALRNLDELRFSLEEREKQVWRRD